MSSLIIRTKMLGKSANPYRLDVRTASLASTDFSFVCGLDSHKALAVMASGIVRFQFSTPDGLDDLLAGRKRTELQVSWDEAADRAKPFRLSAVPVDGSAPVELAMLSYEIADEVVETGMARWLGLHPALDPDYVRSEALAEAAELRARAALLEEAAA